MRQALADPGLLGSILPGESWSPWRTMLVATMGEPLSPEELATFTKYTGRTQARLRWWKWQPTSAACASIRPWRAAS
jgi:hypothetical protein